MLVAERAKSLPLPQQLAVLEALVQEQLSELGELRSARRLMQRRTKAQSVQIMQLVAQCQQVTDGVQVATAEWSATEAMLRARIDELERALERATQS